jgi:hypothetical protein
MGDGMSRVLGRRRVVTGVSMRRRRRITVRWVALRWH